MECYRPMTLKKKILIGYGVSFFLMALVVAWAISNLVALGKASNAILSENYRSILAAENMIDALERQDSGILLVFLGENQKGIEQYRTNEVLFIEWLARAKDNITIPGEEKIVLKIEAEYLKFRQLFSSLTDRPDTTNSQKGPSLDVYQAVDSPPFLKGAGALRQASPSQ